MTTVSDVYSPVFTDWLIRIEAEFREMPGLQLTERQMQRLWTLDSGTCAVLLEILVTRGVLRETPGHAFMLATISR